MRKLFLSLSFVLLTLALFSQVSMQAPPPVKNKQNDTAFKYYEMGLKAFNQGKIRSADSLYSLSIKISKHPDTYYNRSIARSILRNTEGYCEDLCHAAALGDKECDTLFRKECGSADTIYTDNNNKPATRLKHDVYNVLYQSKYKNGNISVRYNNKGVYMSAVELGPDPKANSLPQEAIVPEFPGGKPSMDKFIKTTLKYPTAAKTKNISGVVIVKFVVNRWGYLENIMVVSGIKDCRECSKEALRVISAMPKWTPGSMKGSTARYNYSLPINFTPGT